MSQEESGDSHGKIVCSKMLHPENLYCRIFFTEWMGLEIYVKQYCEFREDGMRKGVYKMIRYAPVSYKQFALAFLDTFSVGNLLMPLLGCLILPMLLTGIRYYSRHRSRS